MPRFARLPGELEQVHVRGIKRRVLRLEYVAGIALLAMGLGPVTARAQGVATATTLHVQAAQGGEAQAAIAVTGADEQPVGGVVNILDGNRQLAQVALNAEGQATAKLLLPGGDHALSAVYLGDGAHRASTSAATPLQTSDSTTPGFTLGVTAVSPATLPMTLTAGQTGSLNVTVTPVNNSLLTAPMFVTLSCSGLPSLASCSFAPVNVQILSTTPASCPAGSPASACPPTSLMVIQTQSSGNAGPHVPAARKGTPLGLAFLLPGMLGLGGLAWGARRRRWLQRMALIALIGLVTTLGTTGCNPFYYYYNHGPGVTPATPAGTYTVTVTAQSSNGVTAISNSTTMVLTVQ